MDTRATDSTWEVLSSLVQANDTAGVRALLDTLEPFDVARAVSRLTLEDRTRLLEALEPAEAADLVAELSDAQAARLIEGLSVAKAAAILDEIPSDDQADLLGLMPNPEAILEEMSPLEASDARRLLDYRPDTAGGLMITEYLAFRGTQTVGEIVADLERNRGSYADYSVQYLYVVDDAAKLEGVLRMRDLVFSSPDAALSSVMIRNPISLNASAPLDDVRQFFERRNYLGVPVVEADGRLVGVVRPLAVAEETGRKTTRQFLRVSGIVGGEEFRTMPMFVRSGRRLSWLSINIVLNIVAASVIALYTDTLAAAIALAVFLPMISDMSGCSGNQAVAVSLRELTLGLVRPREVLRVIGKEAGVGAINGVVLGALLAGVAMIWKGNAYLGLIVGVSLAANTLLAVCLGGSLPLILKRVRLDPALVSGPLLTTVTDMCGFFLVLSLASLMLTRL
ncbi:MAG: magnesium transporter [Candidatus Krumholzibacteria bacterium]|nr:magnesium transporter [Candidatus Krumholzibacteria bacterium]